MTLSAMRVPKTDLSAQPCVYCGGPKPPGRRSDAKYCSRVCAKRQLNFLAAERNPSNISAQPCVYCGGSKPLGRRRNAKYCSDRCKKRQETGVNRKQSPELQAKWLEYGRRSDRKHRAKRAAKNRQWYYANLDYVRERRRRWEAENPNWARDYRRAHPEIGRRAARERKHKKRANGGYVSERDWKRLLIRYGGRCAYCRVELAIEQDHVIPLIRGGRHTIGNILPTCRSCNGAKFTKLLVEWAGRPSY
jgi:5-methylcytosine-specific restriction endonuclease McrA